MTLQFEKQVEDKRGNILFLSYAALINSFPMLFMSMFTLGMNIYGWSQWNKN